METDTSHPTADPDWVRRGWLGVLCECKGSIKPVFPSVSPAVPWKALCLAESTAQILEVWTEIHLLRTFVRLIDGLEIDVLPRNARAVRQDLIDLKPK